MKLLATALLIASTLGAQQIPAIFAPGTRVLFQGDSITDMGRHRNTDPNHLLGHGYVFLIAADFGATYPEKAVTFLNRGISGNKVADLRARWQAETLDLKPDVLSILVGVNDVDLAFKAKQIASAADYEAALDQLLAETRAALPKVKLVLCEPFFLPGKHSKDNLAEWEKLLPQFREAVARLAAKYKAPVVHFQTVFDEACKRAPIEYWIWDGIHPTYSGHKLMADEWVRSYKAFYGTTP